MDDKKAAELDPGLGLHTVVRALRLQGPLDEDRLSGAVAAVTEGFPGLEGRRQGPRGLEIVEGTDLVEDVVRIVEATRRSLHPEAEPWRTLLIRHSATERTLVFGAHRAAFDQASFPILAEALSLAYGDQSLSKLPEANHARTSPEPTSSTDYFHSLAGFPTFLEFPLKGPRKQPMAVSTEAVDERWTTETATRLQGLSDRWAVSPLVVASAAAGYILTRFSGQPKILFGMPFSLRGPGSQAIGGLTHGLPVGFDAEAGSTFSTLVQAWSSSLDLAAPHVPDSFHGIPARLGIKDEPTIHPLFQAACETEETFLPLFTGCQTLPMELAPGPQQLDLMFQFSAKGFRIVFSDQIIARDQAEAVGRSLNEFTTAALEHPERPLTELPIIGEADRRVVVTEMNATEVPEFRDRDLYEVLSAHWATNPDKVALQCGSEALTYAQLTERVEAIDAQIRSVDGNLIGISLPRSVDMVAAVLAVLRSGKAYVPLDPTLPPDRLLYMIEHTGLTKILTKSTLQPLFEGCAATFLLVDQTLPSFAGQPPARPDSESLAYIIYTSGSTGKPKGVQIPRRALANLLQSMLRVPGVSQEDRWCALATLSFDMSKPEILAAFCVGGTVVVATQEETKDPRQLQTLLVNAQVTILQATPMTWRMLFAAGWPGDQKLKALCGAEPMVPALARQLLPKVASLWNMYGPTETTVWSTCTQIVDDSPISVGGPMANTTVYVLDTVGRPLPPGVEGQLYIGGDGVARGYLGDPELSDQRFIPDPFRTGHRIYDTGDRAKFDVSGRLFITGRSDFQVKIRGYRIELGEIETRLATFPGVTQVVAVVRKDEPDNPELVAYYTGSSEFPATGLRDHCAATLPSYMVPSHFKWMETFPHTPNGKVDRKALPAPISGPKPNDLSSQLAAILGSEQINPDLSFIDHGGDSLSFIRASHAVEKFLGWVPDRWEREPLGALVKRSVQTDRGWLTTIDSSVLARAIGILLVPLEHFSILFVGGANTILLFVAGWSLGTLQLNRATKNYNPGAFFKSALAMILPTTVFDLINMAVAGKGFDWTILFMVSTYVTPPHEGGYWFINVLSQIYILFGLVFLIPQVRRLVEKNVFAVFLGASFVFLAISSYFFLATAGHPIKTPLQELWLVCLGISAVVAKNKKEQLALVALILLSGWDDYYLYHDYVFCALSPVVLLIVLYLPKLTFPRILVGPIVWVAGASLYIYLSHTLLRELIDWCATVLHVPFLRRVSVALVVALAGGIAIWRLWDGLTLQATKGFRRLVRWAKSNPRRG